MRFWNPQLLLIYNIFGVEMKNRGISLVELMVAIGIMVMVFSVVFTTYLTTHRLWRGGFTQVAFQSRGRVVLARISENLRSATGATIFNNGDRIRFITDPNRTPETTADDITCEYYISGTDIVYDPNTSIAGNETTSLRKVYKESTIPFFQLSGDLIVVTFRLYNSDAVYGTQWSSMTTSVKMRNG
jgi:Tfp pilus assembly protein PilW